MKAEYPKYRRRMFEDEEEVTMKRARRKGKKKVHDKDNDDHDHDDDDSGDLAVIKDVRILGCGPVAVPALLRSMEMLNLQYYLSISRVKIRQELRRFWCRLRHFRHRSILCGKGSGRISQNGPMN